MLSLVDHETQLEGLDTKRSIKESPGKHDQTGYVMRSFGLLWLAVDFSCELTASLCRG